MENLHQTLSTTLLLFNSILQIDSMHFIEHEQTFIVTGHILCMIENSHK